MSNKKNQIIVNGVPEKTMNEFDNIKTITGLTRNTFLKGKLAKIIEDFYQEHPSKRPKSY